mgnify:CR=1 FL=1
MAFFNALQAFVNLDVVFFVNIIMQNLFWVFAFYIMVHIFFEGKNTVYWFVFWSLVLWAILDWQDLTGFVFTAGAFLFLYYLSKIALLAFAESVPSLKRYLVVLSTISAYILIVVYAFFLK